ncbi:hypothetical protein AMTRI_Chr02g261580 [Amborella trichopoda]
MKKDSNGESVQPLQRQTSKSRESSSVSSPNRFLSPAHRKFPDTRKNKNSEELVLIRGPWPSAMSSSSSSSSLSQSSNFTSSLSTNSSSSSSLSSFSSILSARRESGTLADHLGNERLMDLIDKRERRHSKSHKQRTLRGKKASFSLKENRPMGGSMRYTDPNSNSSQFPIPGRLSIDARTLNFSSRNWSDNEDRSVGPDSDGSGSIDLSNLARKKPGNKIPDRFWREISPGSGKKEGGSQWALSLGRGGHMGLRPPSPPSPVKTKGGDGVVLLMDDAGQELRVLNNRLLQWRFLNTKAQFLAEKKATFAQDSPIQKNILDHRAVQNVSNIGPPQKLSDLISYLSGMPNKAQRMASLLPELARVVTKEMALLEETFELLGVVADLELEERSLRCHIIQLRTQQHKDELPSRVVHP